MRRPSAADGEVGERGFDGDCAKEEYTVENGIGEKTEVTLCGDGVPEPSGDMPSAPPGEAKPSRARSCCGSTALCASFSFSSSMSKSTSPVPKGHS